MSIRYGGEIISGGKDGFSPIVTTAPNANNDGTTITITDVNGPKTFEVLNGKDGNIGPQGPSATINGVNTLIIKAGEKIKLQQTDGTFIIDCTASNHNLLDNWYFVDPVNQRDGKLISAGTTYYSDTALTVVAGVTAQDFKVSPILNNVYFIDSTNPPMYVSGNDVRKGYVNAGYTIDRWHNNVQQTIWVTNSGIVLPENMQEFLDYRGEPDLLNVGDIVTVSAIENGALISGSFAVSGEDFGSHVISPSIKIRVVRIDTFFVFGLLNISSNSVTVSAVKLERGPVQTLAHQDASGNWVLNDPPPNYVLELIKCQRYFLRLPGEESAYTLIGHGKVTSNSQLDLQLNIPVPMRVTPTVRMTGNWVAIGAGGYETFSAENMSIIMSSSGVTEVSIIISGFSNLNTNHVYTIQRNNDPSGTIDLDADL